MPPDPADLELRLGNLERRCAGARLPVEAWIGGADEADLYRACPVDWASAAGLEVDDAVRYLLYAVTEGLVRIGWELNCPGCGLLIDSVERLGEVDNHFHCEMCDEGKDLALDDWIHVTFSVRPEVRPLPSLDPSRLSARETLLTHGVGKGVVMRDGEPLTSFLARSIFLFDDVAPGASATAKTTAEPGLLLTCPTAGVALNDECPTASTLSLEFDERGKLIGLPNELPTGEVEVTVRNPTGETHRVWMFQSADFYRFGPPSGYTAARLIHHPTYVELFPDQLACSGGLTIRSVTLLFSDLVGSTAMYRDIGDFRAYERVREHFAVLAPVISEHGGIWVKDIGDAIMASFPSVEAATRAALAMHREVRAVEGLELKIGVHSGTCIGVHDRGKLDWFGSTVNLAARVQALAGPRELCVTDSDIEAVRPLVSGMEVEALTTEVRGIEHPIHVHRIKVP